MPSLLLSSPSELDELKKSKKKSKRAESMAAELDQNGFIVEEKKSKKKKHKKLEFDEGESDSHDGEGSAKKKSKKKRKASDEETSETSSDGSDPVLDRKVAAVNGFALKKPKLMKEDEDGEVIASREEAGAANPNPNAVSKFRISKVLREKLKSKGIESLFPIQAMTFDLILDGSDLVGRARTGQGKTLAFVLPILESLTNGQHKASRKTGYGRPPSVLVLLPTRELANQVYADFEVYGGAVGLSSCCLYGGSPYRAQELSLKRGVDIVVGTPGRIKDHIERGTVDLKFLKFRVLDEADEMLNMGFVDDVELILRKVEDVSKVQTLLFSATLPEWVKKISARFLKPDKKTADLVGNEKLKASASVRHLVLPFNFTVASSAFHFLNGFNVKLPLLSGGRTIIFTETKESASQLAGLLPGSRALHGDIVQAQREVILAGFRSGRFLVLVATNVAARGLDIHDVQLIIQCEPPRDVESYIHRSGRTGRAGNTGVSILLYEPRYSYSISRLERESGVKFEHISAPQPADVAESAGSEVADSISNVSDSVVPVFRSQAEQLLSSSGLSAVDLLAKALAKAAGYTDIKKRSLLSSMENYVTLLLQAGKTMYSPSLAFSILRRFMPDEKIEGVKGLSLTADGMGVVFDVPADDVDAFIQGQENANMVTIEVLKSLPPLQAKDQSRGGNANTGRGRFGGGRSSGGRRGNGGFGRRDGGGRGKGNGGGRNRFSRR
ncbi:DEAD-box ATP-dependent RNA helicase 7 [Cocos nucifera]|uniref:DEAD-box ATP-dependent RNA helicase 7 n=1 Tax=Cocos nucifera TaxID=13894 RepID=A0A8K0IJQ9_COCNU|nr:DEAD-box ATP-dependent RNA helicase 7 [Cocos nucifera]